MKKKFAEGFMLASMLALIISCNSKKEEHNTVVVNKEEIRKLIQAKEDAFAELYNTGMLKEIGYYANDATSYFPNRPPLIGKEAIANFFSSAVTTKSDKISFKTQDVFVSNDGNQVVEIGFFKVVDSSNTAINTGNYMSLFEKRNGQYVCIRDMSASDMPVQ